MPIHWRYICPTVPFLLLTILTLSCEPWATSWEDIEEAVLYKARVITPPPVAVDTLVVMTWNIRYGAARIPWFGDSCGDRVILTEVEVMDWKAFLARSMK